MSGLSEIVDSLENKLLQLVNKLELLEQEKQEIENELSKSVSINNSQSEEIASLKKNNETLRMTNSLLGSDENKRETKLKINSLIREIDYCIAQLSD